MTTPTETLQSDAQVVVTPTFVDQLGVPVDASSTQWATSDVTVFSFSGNSQSTSGASVTVVAQAVGTATLTATLGEVTLEATITITAPTAFSGTLGFGTPTAKS
jgi:hypothetical protein